MSEEELIKYIKSLNEITKKNNKKGIVVGLEISTDMADAIINLIEKLQKEKEEYRLGWCNKGEECEKLKAENQKQDKMIDLMAKYIDDYSIEDEFCTKKNCYADDYINGHCEKCLNCIKEHFRKKCE